MEENGDVPEGSVAARNFRALDERNKQLKEEIIDLERRIRVMENKIVMQETLNGQHQQMFAMQMVARGSGPTTE